MSRITNEKIYDVLTEIKVEQAEVKKDVKSLYKIASTNSNNLAEHIKRTNLLEKKIEQLETPWVWALNHKKDALALIAVATLFVMFINEIKEYLTVLIKSLL